MPPCDVCRKEVQKLNKCGKCKQRFYCGTTCQRTDWNKGGHKSSCQTNAAATAAEATAKITAKIEARAKSDDDDDDDDDDDSDDDDMHQNSCSKCQQNTVQHHNAKKYVFDCCGAELCPRCKKKHANKSKNRCPRCSFMCPKSMSLNMVLERAKAGHAFAQFNAGMHYLMSHDVRKAVVFLKQAADQDHPEACNTYGFLLLGTDGVGMEREVGMELITRSARMGFASANFWLGMQYASRMEMKRMEVPGTHTNRRYKTPNEAFSQFHLKKAAKHGHGSAMVSLALCYGRSVEGALPDKTKAMLWIQRAKDGRTNDQPDMNYSSIVQQLETFYDMHPNVCSTCLAIDSSSDLSKVSPKFAAAVRSDQNENIQVHLAKPHQKLKFCKCKEVLYCCKEHQIQDRQRHRSQCKQAKLRRKYIRARNRAGGEYCCPVRLVHLKSKALNGKIGFLGSWKCGRKPKPNWEGRFTVVLDHPAMNGNDNGNQRKIGVKIGNFELV